MEPVNFKRSWILHLIIFVVLGMATMSSHWWAFSAFSSSAAMTGGLTRKDSVEYIKMVDDLSDRQVMSPFKYRYLTPYLVHFVPLPPSKVVPNHIKIYPDNKPTEIDGKVLRFTVVNSVFTWGTVVVLFYFLLALGFSPVFSFIGSLAYLNMIFSIMYNPLPLIDAGAQFFMVAGLLCILKQRHVALFFCILIGLFAKEVIGVLLIGAWLLDRRTPWLKIALFSIPPIVIYFGVRSMDPAFFFHENQITPFISLIRKFVTKHITNVSFYPDVLFRTFVWSGFFAIYAWVAHRGLIPSFIKRQTPLLVLIAAQVAIANNVGRLIFLACPLILPAGLVGLQQFFNLWNRACPGSGALADGSNSTADVPGRG